MKRTSDTNTLISATFWNGSSNKIISKVEAKKLGLVLSKEIVKEYAEVLDYEEIKKKIKGKKLDMKLTVEKIKSMSTIIVPKEKLDIIKDDPDDNAILECAIAGNVDCVVSSDKHLLRLKKFRDIPILTPDDFIERYNRIVEF